MARHRIPTARFHMAASLDDALRVVRSGEFGMPVVLKADGLAAGKGVVIAADLATAEEALVAAMRDRRFGAAGDTVVIEECLSGPEVSFFVISDGDARAADRLGSGSQADFRRRPGTEHGRNGRVRAEPVVRRGALRRVSCARSSTRSSPGWPPKDIRSADFFTSA